MIEGLGSGFWVLPITIIIQLASLSHLTTPSFIIYISYLFHFSLLQRNRTMPKNWDDQDDAFFGDLHSSKPSADEKLARRLQKRYVKEQEEARRISEKEDREFAQRIQSQGSATAKNYRPNNGRNASYARRKESQEDEDAALARKIQEEEQSTNNLPASSGRRRDNRSNYPGERRGMGSNQTRRNHTFEDDDAALARKIQEKEESSRIYAIPPNRRRNGLGSLIPTCAACNKMVIVPLSALGKIYHAECFRCVACHKTINSNERFNSTIGDDGEKHPLHQQCYAELYGLHCSVCRQTMESDSTGRVSYMKHPFFDNEYMCPKHAQDSIRRCTGCFRFEPMGSPFANLSDADRCVCDSCLRSVIVDSDDATPLWTNVIQFIEDNLKLPIWPSMKEIPILIVGHNALNDQMRNTGHGGSSQIMTRGLCLSEHQRGFNFMLPQMRFDHKQNTFQPSDRTSQGYTYFQIPDASVSNPNNSVTAILCLSGLPRDLTASILAHEATHAWIKLHPQFDVSKPIPAQVEEGCCQLIAMLFLNDGLAPIPRCENNDNGPGPSDKKLRQYFKFSIETDTNEVYGEGYRKAALSYSKIGVEALMSHVVNYQEFPNV